jgi:ribosomal protein L7/L12
MQLALSSKQALKLVKAVPGPVITGMPRVQAEALKIQFEALGAVVQLTPSSVS